MQETPDPRGNKLLVRNAYSGTLGGSVLPLLLALVLIVVMIVTKGDASSFFMLLLYIAIFAGFFGLLIGMGIGFLFIVINKFFNFQHPTLYRVSLFLSPIFSFTSTFLLCGYLLWLNFRNIVAHG